MGMALQHEVGPVYGVKLIRVLNCGSMFQAMPGRQELQEVRKNHERVVSGYELLLSHRTAYRQMLADVIAAAESSAGDAVKVEISLRNLAQTARELLEKTREIA